MPGLFQEIRHACRILARSPGFTAVAVLSLGLGIGANSALFSLHDALMWRPLPVRDPGSVLSVTTDRPDDVGLTRGQISYPNYRDLRDSSRSFDGLVAHSLSNATFARSREDAREMRMGMLVSDNFFDVLGVQPLLGRVFAADEGKVPGRDAVVVLAYDFWKNGLGEDRSIVGRIVHISGVDFNVIGVTPESFTGMDPFIRPAFFVPLMMAGRITPELENRLEDRNARTFLVKGRLKPGESQSRARSELTILWTELIRRYPDANRDHVLGVWTALEQRMRDSPGNTLLVSLMTTLVAIVLMIACANVANLMLGRARARAREIAIRLALGVSRMRLLRQLLTESLMLALLGCAVGLGLAYAGIRFLTSSARMIVQSDLPLVIAPQLDGRVLAFSLFATVVSALLFGLAPAWQSVKTEVVPALKSGEPRQIKQRTIGRNVLVSAQVALSMVLLVAAGMLTEGFRRSLDLDPGYRTDHLMTISLDTTLARHSPAQTRNFYRELVDRARRLPGVAAATLTSAIPLNDFDDPGRETVAPEGFQFPRGQQNASVRAAAVDEHYFDTMQTRLVRGRAFTAADNESSRRVAIVNEAFANTYWPSQNPIGKRIRLTEGEGTWLEVVGVAETGKYGSIREAPTPFLYKPFEQDVRAEMSLVLETTSADPASITSPLRDLVRSIDVNMPIFNARTVANFYEQSAIGPQLLLMRTVSTMGLLGLTMALIGLYGLVSYSVARRTREIGVRMALGASAADVSKMVLRQGLTLAGTGVVVGGLACIGVTRMLTAGMAGLGAPNLATYIIVPVLLVALTLGASYLPARRAAAVDPLKALRYE